MPGLAIRRRRDALRLTQKEVARLLHMSQSSYSRIENQQVSLTIEQARRIAEVLQCRLDDFLPDHAVLENRNEVATEIIHELVEAGIARRFEELKQWMLHTWPPPAR